MSRTAGLLLDTHVAIWMVEDRLIDAARSLIRRAEEDHALHVSPVTAWEIGLLARPRGDRPPRLAFAPDPERWVARLMARPTLRPAPLTPAIMLASTTLPEPLHGDPADRMLIATARDMNLTLVTADRRILYYAEAGHLAAAAC